MAHLLLVEDDPVLGKGLSVGLQLDGYQVSWAQTVQQAKDYLKQNAFQLAILDLNLPDGSGLFLANALKGSSIPFLMLTASGDEDSVVGGFEAGAADYVRKPFSNRELKARIQVILKEESKEENHLEYAGISVQKDKRLVKWGERAVELNRREFDIFCHFVAHAENVVTRDSLLKLLNKEGEIFDRTIDSHVSHLRRRLRKAGIESVQIASIYGVGYRLEKRA
jgi:DNA-binding response OmpR family regulator